MPLIFIFLKEYFPNAIRCIDFFHVVQWVNNSLDEVRINTAIKATRETKKQSTLSLAYEKLEGLISNVGVVDDKVSSRIHQSEVIYFHHDT